MNESPVTRLLPLPDGDIALRQWAGPGPSAPHLLFLHANGMCAAIYDALLAPLASHARVTAYDARGHGATTLPADPAQVPLDWHIYRRDLAQLAAALGGEPPLIAGHSLGATTAFHASRDHPALARRLLLIDPPFIPFADAPACRAMLDAGQWPPNPLADRASRRSAHFPSRAVARKIWRGRAIFADWPDDALDAYLRHALHDAPDGGVTLACTPAWESATYRGVSTRFAAAMEQPGPPFALLIAEHGSPVPPADVTRIRALHPQAAIHQMPGTGHMLPVTHADDVRRWLYGLVSGDFPER